MQTAKHENSLSSEMILTTMLLLKLGTRNAVSGYRLTCP